MSYRSPSDDITHNPQSKKPRFGFDTIRRKDVDHNFNDILSFHVPTPTTSALERYIRNGSTEPQLVCYFDYPGVGKTATCFHAAKNADAFYLKLRMDGGLIKRTDQILQKYWNEKDVFFKKERKSQDILNFVKTVCYATIATLLTHANVMLLPVESSFMQISENGIEIPESYDQFKMEIYDQIIEGRIRDILTNSKKKKLFIHVDECQYWCSDKSFSIKRDTDEDRIFKGYEPHLENYKLSGLSACLASIMVDHTNVVVAMSGTNTDLTKRVLIDTLLKEWSPNPTIPYTTVETISKIVNHYYDLAHVENTARSQLLANIYKALCGPARLTQQFLKQLRSFVSTPKEAVTFEDISHAAAGTRMWFKGTVLRGEDANEKMPIYNAMAVTWLYPGFIGGKVGQLNTFSKIFTEFDEDEDNEKNSQDEFLSVVSIDSASIPSEWMAYADMGIVRWVTNAETTCMIEPFPYLAEEWASVSKLYFEKKEIKLLKYRLTDLSKGGHGNAFQLAVALGLTVL
jgi:hypothetical protein